MLQLQAPASLLLLVAAASAASPPAVSPAPRLRTSCTVLYCTGEPRPQAAGPVRHRLHARGREAAGRRARVQGRAGLGLLQRTLLHVHQVSTFLLMLLEIYHLILLVCVYDGI